MTAVEFFKAYYQRFIADRPGENWADLDTVMQDGTMKAVTELMEGFSKLGNLSTAELEEMFNEQHFADVVWNNIDFPLAGSDVKVNIEGMRGELLHWIKDTISFKNPVT